MPNSQVKLDDLSQLALDAKRNPARRPDFLSKAEPLISQAMRSTGESPALRMRAKSVLLDAVDRYDPKHNANFKTYAFMRLQELSRTAQNLANPWKPQAAHKRVAKDVATFSQDFIDTHGREPTDEEISDSLHINPSLLYRSRATLPESAFVDDEGDPSPPGVTSSRTNMLMGTVYHSLDRIGQKVFEWSYGWNGQKTLSVGEMAAKLRVSPAAISQRRARIGQLMMEASKYE